MSGTNKFCSGCRQPITDRRFLCCVLCRDNYDLLCANVSEQRFNNTLTGDHRANWKCVTCVSRQPKTDNANTPVRPADDGVTIRRGGSASASNHPQNQMDMSMVDMTPLDSCSLNDNSHNDTEELSPTRALITEMRLFRQQLMVTSVQMGVLNDTMLKLSSRMDAYEERVGGLEERMHILEERGKTTGAVGTASADGSLLAVVEQLKAQLNDRDQEALLNEIEISCVPEVKGDNLSHVITTLARKIGVTLAEQDVVSVVRVGRAPEPGGGAADGRPRPIVVRLARRAVRDELLREARVRRGATTEGVGLPGPPRRFYFNERLTRANRQLFRRAREIGTRLGWRFVWTRNGNVFARQRHGHDAPRHRLRTEEDLVRVFGDEAVGAASAAP